MSIDKKKLQRLINASTKANNAVLVAEQALNDFCDEEWGFAPADRDVDAVLDGCMGGCGQAHNMPADEFIEAMNIARGDT